MKVTNTKYIQIIICLGIGLFSLPAASLARAEELTKEIVQDVKAKSVPSGVTCDFHSIEIAAARHLSSGEAQAYGVSPDILVNFVHLVWSEHYPASIHDHTDNLIFYKDD